MNPLKIFVPALLFSAAISANGAAIHTGLLNYWALDGDANDTASSLAGSTGVTNDNGTVNNATAGSVTFTAGMFGNAATFAGGAGNNITVPDGGASTLGGVANDVDRTGSDMSLSVWFKATAWDTTWQGIVSHGEQQDYRIARNNATNPVSFAAVMGTTDMLTTTTYGATPGGDGLWHNVTITGTNLGAASIYVDGVLSRTSVGLADPTVSIAQSTANLNRLCIGCNPDNGREFKGQIDDIGLWDRELSAAEVAQIYTAGQNGISLGAIPEPALGSLFALTGSLLLARRRR